MHAREHVLRAVHAVPGVRIAEGWITTEATLAGPAHAAPDRFGVTALPADTRLFVPEIEEGRFFQPDDVDVLILNSALATRAPHLRVGDTVRLGMGPGEVTFRIVGKAREPFSSANAYVPRRFFDEKEGHAGLANGLRLALDGRDAESIAAARAGLDSVLEGAGVKVTHSAAQSDGRYAFDQHMLMIYAFLIVMAAILVGVGGLGLVTTMSLNLLERRREMGVLRAIGATPRAVGLIVVAEATATAVLGWALAAVLAWPMSEAVGRTLVTLMFRSPLAFRLEPWGLAIWLAVSLALAALASFVPARRAWRRPIREAIAYE
jgi:putative ABC transport system permease protein